MISSTMSFWMGRVPAACVAAWRVWQVQPLGPLLRWLGACTLFALVSACGGGDAATENFPAGSGSVTTEQSLKVLPQRLGLAIGDDGALLALGSVAATTWSSSDPRVATVDAAGRVKALAKGTAVVSARSGTNVATASLTVYRTDGANPDPTTEALIAAALAQKKIDAEHALMYRIFALFGDERLPTEFDGAPSTGSNHLVLREMTTTIGTLSPATQEVLRPFMVPPIYPASWFAQRLGLTAPAQPSDPTREARLATEINCAVSITPSLYARVSTRHFNVYYLVFGGDSFKEDNASSAAAAALVASLIEEVYDAETKLIDPLDRLDDSKEACNGGDAKYDIYYFPGALFRLAAWTTTYPLAQDLIAKKNVCALRPSYMLLNSLSIEFQAAQQQPARARPMVKSILAHELLHALQYTMDRKASCEDVAWFDEATSQWVMDHVVKTIPQGDPGEFGMEPGLGRVAANYAKSGYVLAAYLLGGTWCRSRSPAPASTPS